MYSHSNHPYFSFHWHTFMRPHMIKSVNWHGPPCLFISFISSSLAFPSEAPQLATLSAVGERGPAGEGFIKWWARDIPKNSDIFVATEQRKYRKAMEKLQTSSDSTCLSFRVGCATLKSMMKYDDESRDVFFITLSGWSASGKHRVSQNHPSISGDSHGHVW